MTQGSDKEVFHNCHCHEYVIGELNRIIRNREEECASIPTDDPVQTTIELAKKQCAIMELQDLKENL